MMGITHAVFSVAFTSLGLGTANPFALVVAALASQFPDIDTSRSVIGRILFPVSRFLEKRHPHRSVTHSFFASGVVVIATYPLLYFWDTLYWKALILGYFLGWFADVFTKSGVTAFYPSKVRMIIPANPRLRLGTRSNAEWFLLFILVAISVLSINLNSAGGLLRGFNQVLGLPSGAIETVNEDASRYLLAVTVKGRNAITEQPIDATYEVIEPLTANDLLARDERGIVYRIGSSQECQIVVSQMRVERSGPVRVEIENLTLEDETLETALSRFVTRRVYLTGTLTIEDAEDLSLPTHIDRFDTITLQPGSVAYARLTSASPGEIIDKLGEHSVSGNLIVRIVHVQ
jgi:inner membrane protein